MIAFEQGDVVLVAFPFTDLTTTKCRPALIVSNALFNRSGVDVIVAGITSQLSGKRQAGDVLVPPLALGTAGLPKASMVRLGKLVTLDSRIIKKTLGSLPEGTMEDMLRTLSGLLSMDEHGLLRESDALYRTTARKKKKTDQKNPGNRRRKVVVRRGNK